MTTATAPVGRTTLVQVSTAARLMLGVILACSSAACLNLAMPPHGIWPLAILGFLPMILAQYRILPARFSSLGSAITIGGLVGFYIMDAFLQLPGAPWYMRLLPVLFGLFVLLADSRTRAFHERTAYRWFIMNGALGWVGVEMIRGMIPVLGTWGFIGYAYYKQPWMIQPVSVFGMYGLDLLNMLLSYALGLAFLAWFDQRWRLDPAIEAVGPRRAGAWLLVMCAASAAWLGLSLLQFDSHDEDPIRAAAVQTGFKSLWTAEEAQSNWLSSERFEEIYHQHFDLLLEQTQDSIASGVDLIVWPEGALNFDPQMEQTRLLRQLAADSGAHFVIPYGVGFRNEVTLLNPDGEFLGVYGKNHPVLFVHEKSATHGTYPTYDTHLGSVGMIICYDLDFTDTARKVARSGADLIAVPSGDWPGIADVHYAHLVFRAVENRVVMIKADRSYDSAIIDPYGRILSLTSSQDPEARTLIADVSLVHRDPWQQWLGDWIGWLSLGGMLVFAVYTPLALSSGAKRA